MRARADFKYGLRPSAAEVLNSPFLPPQAESLPFSPIKRRYTGYSKFAGRIQEGVAAYSGSLVTAIQNKCVPRRGSLVGG